MNPSNLRRILLVDDEPHIIAAVRRELRLPPNDIYDYAVETFSDPVAALERCATVHFDAVISDYRMPGMDGVEFIRRVRTLFPDCARIILSGQTDMPALVRMVNELDIYRFIAKPWNPYYLKATLGQAIDYSEILARHRELSALAAGSGTVVKVPEADAAARVLIVEADAAVLESIVGFLRMSPESSSTAPPEVQGVPSEAQARELIESTRYACVIAAHDLPGKSGVDLLGYLAHRQPDCLRILLGSGIAQEELVRAVNVAHIHAFVEKPRNLFELQNALLQGLQQRRMHLETRRLAELLEKPAVPPAPTFHEIDPDDDDIKRG